MINKKTRCDEKSARLLPAKGKKDVKDRKLSFLIFQGQVTKKSNFIMPEFNVYRVFIHVLVTRTLIRLLLSATKGDTYKILFFFFFFFSLFLLRCHNNGISKGDQ